MTSKTLELIHNSLIKNRVIFCSFDWRVLRYIQQQNKDQKIWFLTYPLGWYDTQYKNSFTLALLSKKEKIFTTAWNSGTLAGRLNCIAKTPSEIIKCIKDLDADAWLVYYGDVTATLIEEAHENGLKMVAWTNGDADEKQIKKIIGDGVDAICVDYPASFKDTEK